MGERESEELSAKGRIYLYFQNLQESLKKRAGN